MALAGLIVGTVAEGAAQQSMAARGMIAGAVGLTIYSVVAVPALRHLGPGKGAALAGLGWLVAAALIFPVVG